MPDAGLKSSFLTIKLFKEVVENECWLPKHDKFKFKYCLRPPSVDALIEMISDGILTMNAAG
jgi:hypothetical protein